MIFKLVEFNSKLKELLSSKAFIAFCTFLYLTKAKDGYLLKNSILSISPYIPILLFKSFSVQDPTILPTKSSLTKTPLFKRIYNVLLS